MRLYAEAIQVVEARQLCWARPTLLIQGLPIEEAPQQSSDRQTAIADAALNPESAALSFYDLEDCSDLIWPVMLFNTALDIDFFALLAHLRRHRKQPASTRSQQQLNSFIRCCWQAHRDIFLT